MINSTTLKSPAVAKNATTSIEALLEKEGKMNISLIEDSLITEFCSGIKAFAI